MNQNTTLKTALVAIPLLVAAVVVDFLAWNWNKEAAEPPVQEELTDEIALALLREHMSDGCLAEGIPEKYRSCTLTVSKGPGHWLVTVTHDGFFDDSVKASQLQAIVTHVNGTWVKGDVTETFQCWPGRGHQDFSSELCV
jgi:hypothetical protein